MWQQILNMLQTQLRIRTKFATVRLKQLNARSKSPLWRGGGAAHTKDHPTAYSKCRLDNFYIILK